MPLPTGRDFVELLGRVMEARPIKTFMAEIPERKAALLGTSFAHLYRISTCDPTCRGGDHLLEALVGRCFNHGLGSLRLIGDCLYDESLNLTRSIAEITNLMFLFSDDPSAESEWRSATRKKRMTEFGPGGVRDRLGARGVPLPVTKEAYTKLCEVATHATPLTRPNRHTEQIDRAGLVGGIFEENGHKVALENLLLYTSLSSLVACKIFGLTDEVRALADLGRGTFDA